MSVQSLTPEQEQVVLRAYAEASLAAREKGLSGSKAVTAVLNAAAKVASRITGFDLTPEEVERIIRP